MYRHLVVPCYYRRHATKSTPKPQCLNTALRLQGVVVSHTKQILDEYITAAVSLSDLGLMHKCLACRRHANIIPKGRKRITGRSYHLVSERQRSGKDVGRLPAALEQRQFGVSGWVSRIISPFRVYLQSAVVSQSKIRPWVYIPNIKMSQMRKTHKHTIRGPVVYNRQAF